MEKNEIYTHPPAQPVEPAAGEVTAWLYTTHLEQKFVSLFRRTHYDGFPLKDEAPLYGLSSTSILASVSRNERPTALDAPTFDDRTEERVCINGCLYLRADFAAHRLTHSPAPSATIERLEAASKLDEVANLARILLNENGEVLTATVQKHIERIATLTTKDADHG